MKKIWLVSVIICCIFALTACGSIYERRLVGTWYHEGSSSEAFTLYDDGTCEISGEYGTGTWAVSNDKELIIRNYYGESESAPIVSIKNGCLTLGEGSDVWSLYNEPAEERDVPEEGSVSEDENVPEEENSLTELDAFEGITVVCSGWNNTGRIGSIDTANCSPFIQENFEFHASREYAHLSNGMEVKIQAVYDKEALEREGYAVLEDDHDFEVTGLKEIHDSQGYYEDVAWVQDSEYDWHLCDKMGNILFTLDEDSEPTTYFYNGVSLVDNNRLIDKSGNVIWSVEENAFAYANEKWGDSVESIEVCDAYDTDGTDFFGIIFVHFFVNSYEFTGDFLGIVDHSGNWIMEPKEGYDSADSYFSDTGCVVTLDPGIGTGNEPLYYNIITGEMLTGQNRDVLENWKRKYYCSLHDGLIFEKRNGICSFCDVDGNAILDLSKYDLSEDVGTLEFCGGYALLHIKNEGGYVYYTIIDTEGKEMFPPRKKEYFSNRLTTGFYFIEGQYYDIKTGEPAFHTEFFSCGDFQDGRALVTLKEDYILHFIDESGEIIY